MADLMMQLVGIICTIVGVLAIYIGLRSYRLGKESLRWPTVEGEIISSEVIKRWRRQRTSQKRDEWLAHIVYEYVLDGTKFVSTQIKVSPHSWGSEKRAKKWVSEYSEGRLVRVCHHPTKHEASKFAEIGKIHPKFIAPPEGIEVYQSASSLAPLLIEGKYTKDAKVGNALLKPGVDIIAFILTLLLGAIFTNFGLLFLFVL